MSSAVALRLIKAIYRNQNAASGEKFLLGDITSYYGDILREENGGKYIPFQEVNLRYAWNKLIKIGLLTPDGPVARRSWRRADRRTCAVVAGDPMDIVRARNYLTQKHTRVRRKTFDVRLEIDPKSTEYECICTIYVNAEKVGRIERESWSSTYCLFLNYGNVDECSYPHLWSVKYKSLERLLTNLRRGKYRKTTEPR